ncbi:MAG: hypothetical protein MJE68_01690, partial [Proteobacteria bacterium]|nr:hypothetical protein [Pseudomonadota bacterium]
AISHANVMNQQNLAIKAGSQDNQKLFLIVVTSVASSSYNIMSFAVVLRTTGTFLDRLEREPSHCIVESKKRHMYQTASIKLLSSYRNSHF